ncbi:uncharacterized protein [Arachis hypogaea]|uniref:uncharacterized protein isoform X1 n=1 Tax=Arachis hypogaea TaxID=3818 RepID=UPI000DECAD55|nr:uncharacterized protein LOC112801623 isoform X1 [Arachis hypogaea]XP_025700247.1 uncharacterized protein LOC112801623 isoform X1 [Arachis hypogaea]XP_025700248.1 uncharacterized protein LOC112801623 isoform X1 [Arachis hypogaea]QHO42229.1 putative serine/threonine protein kinase [Arachis hypogaea]
MFTETSKQATFFLIISFIPRLETLALPGSSLKTKLILAHNSLEHLLKLFKWIWHVITQGCAPDSRHKRAKSSLGRDRERMRVAEAGETVLVGLPPFNAEHPQTIFDNILNRNIPWPAVPEEMSPEAQDLIDRLLTEDPNQRLGARGASEVKEHVFFKDINWDTLARQKDNNED